MVLRRKCSFATPVVANGVTRGGVNLQKSNVIVLCPHLINMPKRNKAAAETAPSSDPPVETKMAQEESLQEDTSRTRSGRRLRTPAAVHSSAPAVKAAPSRRTRRSGLQDLPEDEQTPEATVEDGQALVCEGVHKSHTDTADAQNDKDQKEVLCKAKEMPPINADIVPNKKPRVKPPLAIPLGKPKSGRVWKERNKQRFSSVVRDKQLSSSWEKKMQAKREKELVKQYCHQLKDEQNRQKEEKRKRREENLKRRAENERKAEIVQVIRNTTKIKRMKKKQLRKIEKRDTLAMLQRSKDNKQNTTPKAPKSIKEVSCPGSN